MNLERLFQRKSTIAFLMALPLILIITLLVVYPAGYAIHLSTLNKSMERFVGFGNFEFLFGRETFWMVVKQSVIFAVTAVILKPLLVLLLPISFTIFRVRASASGVVCCSCPG